MVAMKDEVIALATGTVQFLLADHRDFTDLLLLKITSSSKGKVTFQLPGAQTPVMLKFKPPSLRDLQAPLQRFGSIPQRLSH